MQRIEMTDTRAGASDGHTVLTYEKGRQYVVSDALARDFVHAGAAAPVVDPALAPDVPLAPAIPAAPVATPLYPAAPVAAPVGIDLVAPAAAVTPNPPTPKGDPGVGGDVPLDGGDVQSWPATAPTLPAPAAVPTAPASQHESAVTAAAPNPVPLAPVVNAGNPPVPVDAAKVKKSDEAKANRTTPAAPPKK